MPCNPTKNKRFKQKCQNLRESIFIYPNRLICRFYFKPQLFLQDLLYLIDFRVHNLKFLLGIFLAFHIAIYDCLGAIDIDTQILLYFSKALS